METFEGEDLGGDGTVPRVSATPHELSEAGRDVFVAERHASLQNNDVVWDQVEGIFRTGQVDLRRFLLPPVRLSVRLDDAYPPGQPVTIRARPDDVGSALQATVTSVRDASISRVIPLTPGPEGWHAGATELLPPDTYRVTVYGDARVLPVTDIVLVA
jgi:hypothetical protein